MPQRVSEVLWDDETIWKLWKEHHVEWWEVEEVLFDDAGADARWHASEKHGTRLLVRGETRGGRRLFVALRPVDPENSIYRCATAFEDEKGKQS